MAGPSSSTSSSLCSGSQKRSTKPTKTKHPESHPPTSTANLARQILNNLNIFSTKTAGAASHHSHNHHSPQQPSSPHMNMFSNRSSDGGQYHHRLGSSHRSRSRTRASDTDTSSLKSIRRPSVDTVSTYLSHESKESLRSRNFTASVNDLLDCSVGSDDVFTQPHSTPPPLPPLPQQSHHMHTIAGPIVGVDPASDMISRFVKVADPPKWPNAQPCPMCMEELVHTTQNPAVSLSRCQHLMHLQCLNQMIIDQQKGTQKVSTLNDEYFTMRKSRNT